MSRYQWMTIPLLIFAVTLAALPSHAGDKVTGQNDAEKSDSPLKVISHNIAGGSGNDGDDVALDTVREQVDTWSPDLVMMQEVCEQQADTFRRLHSTWGVGFAPIRDSHARCSGAPLGNLVAAPTQLDNLTVTQIGGNGNGLVFNLICAEAGTGAGTVTACSTHLRIRYADETLDELQAARLEQTSAIRDTLHPLVSAGKMVVVAGDFNMTPDGWGLEAMSQIYDQDGSGDFHEADQTEASGSPQRSGELTHVRGKIDYIFFSNNHVWATDVDAEVIASAVSDHSLVRGSATVTDHTP